MFYSPGELMYSPGDIYLYQIEKENAPEIKGCLSAAPVMQSTSDAIAKCCGWCPLWNNI